MALLSFNSFTLHSPSAFLVPQRPLSTDSRFHVRPIDVPSKCFSGVRISTPFPFKRTAALFVRAAGANADRAAPAVAGEVLPVDKLPLESKLREREEQRLRMKMAKKIRLRRKRLVRKRRLRKKGRWPPSKMKKLKNV